MVTLAYARAYSDSFEGWKDEACPWNHRGEDSSSLAKFINHQTEAKD
jgi:hypothetical protein